MKFQNAIQELKKHQHISYVRGDRMYYNMTVPRTNRVQTAETTPITITGERAVEIIESLPENYDSIKSITQGDSKGFIIADSESSLDDRVFIISESYELDLPERVCRHCGENYKPVAETQKYCCRGCREEAESE